MSALRFGILSTARIARSFVSGVAPSQSVTVAAVASREGERARAFAQEQHIARHFDCYEALLADPDIDAIYNPLPNGLHAPWSIRALQAGKHVLCEKPLCANEGEARAMFAAAKAHGLHLAEAFPYLSQPQTLKMREMLRQGALGEVRLIQASFAFTLNEAGNVRWSKELAGGALMDVGVYPVSLIRIIAGTLPKRVSAAALWSPGGEAGVDRALAATLEFKSGLLAQITCSFEAALLRQALIVGSRGVLETTFANHTSESAPGDLRLRVGADTRAHHEIIHTEPANGFRAEAEAFADGIRGRQPGWNGATQAESLDIMIMLDALIRSARERAPVELR
jgi:predicted dehydrogenase